MEGFLRNVYSTSVRKIIEKSRKLVQFLIKLYLISLNFSVTELRHRPF